MEELPSELEQRVKRSLHIIGDVVVRECQRELAATEHDPFIDDLNNVYQFKPKQEPEDLVA